MRNVFQFIKKIISKFALLTFVKQQQKQRALVYKRWRLSVAFRLFRCPRAGQAEWQKQLLTPRRGALLGSGAAFYSQGREEKEKQDQMELQTQDLLFGIVYSFLFFCIIKEMLLNTYQTIGYISFLSIPKSKMPQSFVLRFMKEKGIHCQESSKLTAHSEVL